MPSYSMYSYTVMQYSMYYYCYHYCMYYYIICFYAIYRSPVVRFWQSDGMGVEPHWLQVMQMVCIQYSNRCVVVADMSTAVQQCESGLADVGM
jgi:hypothetical protein